MLSSARGELRFEAVMSYGFSVPVNVEFAPVHPHALARSLLRVEAERVSRRFPPLETAEAEDAINAKLAAPVVTDPRLTISGVVRLSLDAETTEFARQEELAERRIWLDEQRETARLIALRERLANDALGLTWWIDKYADLQFATGDPEAKAEGVIQAFTAIRAALRREQIELMSNERDLVLARVDELLTALEDPGTGARAAGLLEQLVHILHSDAHQPSVRQPRVHREPDPR
ncbi:hypothetical protein ACIQ9P_37965 [Kitasatospora sp. NPDC094019]|uniref:hypothetical protein n=1 Tax=Kitasatospora sp. NPDC094019 TaxID=3364091 RepID=UPI0037F6F3F0